MKLNSSKFKPGDHVYVVKPLSQDLIEGYIMFENIGGYMIRTVNQITHNAERFHWSDSNNHFFSQTEGNRIDCSENFIIPYGKAAEVLYMSRGGRIL